MISSKLKNFRKAIEDVRDGKEHALEAIHKDLTSIPYLPELARLDHLRGLTLSHNKITEVPQEISTLQTLEHLNLFNNCIMNISPKIVELTYLRSLNLGLKELHLQNNRLAVLPPELGVLDLCGPKQVAKLSGNDWVSPIEDQLQVGLSHVFDYIRSETYKFLYQRHIAADNKPRPISDKSKKISRKVQ
uniref:SJCHGC02104 protein n=1 Tax=Schistosoma japonicum TaxID=6182 RepID=Q5DA94_SCHJA|nr:SJCHGC02104 protein [Schistosoma japonicum]